MCHRHVDEYKNLTIYKENSDNVLGRLEMEFELTAQQQQLEKEVQGYLEEKVIPELEEEIDAMPEGDGPLFCQLMRQLGADGWLGIGWPKEYGGQGLSPVEQYIFFDLALGYYQLPIPVLTLLTVGPVIMNVGTEEQKRRFLPPILKGELTFSIGYTEPEAGTDIFSLKTTAVRDGDDYIVNGQKTFTSMGHFYDYFWLAVRTDPDASKKHRGISILMVDAKSPGITVKPIWVMGGFRVNHEFFDDVRVPRDCLIGEENGGLEYMIMQLAHERIALVPHSMSARLIKDVTQWAKTNMLNGAPVIEQPWVKNRLAEMEVGTEVLKLLNYRVAWLIAQGIVPHVESAAIKVFGSEHIRRVSDSCLQIMGPFGQLQTGSKWAPLRGRLERMFRMLVMLTFGGGTNEVMRDMIAMMGLGLPRSR